MIALNVLKLLNSIVLNILRAIPHPYQEQHCSIHGSKFRNEDIAMSLNECLFIRMFVHFWGSFPVFFPL